MSPRLTLSVFLAAASLLAAPPSRSGASGQAAPAPAKPAAAQPDTAVLGFLRTVVDRKVYSLEAAGVLRLGGTARATFEVIVPDPALRPATIDLELFCDFGTGVIAARPAKPPTGDQVPIAPLAVNAAQSAFSLLPSRAAAGWTTTLAQDGELFRIDYKPPTPADPAAAAAAPVAGSWSEWHKADGTPVRRRVTSYRPTKNLGEQGTELFTQEVVPAFEAKGDRLLLATLKPGDPQGRFLHEFEYVEKDGLFLLKKLVQSDEGWRLTIEFKLTAERPAAK